MMKTLGEVCKTIYRYPQFYGMEHKTAGVPVVRGEHLLDGKRISENWNDYWFVDKSFSAKFPKTILETGDIVMSVRGSVGKIAYVEISHNGAQISPNLIRISPDKNTIVKKYAFYAIGWAVRRFVSQNTQAQALPSLSASDIKNMSIFCPPLTEQERIAEIFSDTDASIAKTEMLVKKASMKVLSLQQKLINSPLYFGKWNFVSFSDSLLQKKEKTTRPNAYPALTSSRRGIFLQDEYFTRQVTSHDNTGYLIIRKGDFTYRAMAEGDSRFVFNQLLDHDAGIVSPAYFVFGIKDSDPVFFRHLLNCSAFGYAIKKVVQGGTRKALKFNMLKGLNIRLPSKETQIKIGRVLLATEQERDLLQQQVSALKKQKRGLMQKLLTGTWRVNHV